ncbi:MAG TPA: SDR family oxidoreductase [Bauldia sp.]|nr:SDR family oxidoreductase [Bauldia sp.]
MTAARNAATRAIITGGAQGLGLAVAKQLAAEGATQAALVGRSRDKGAAAVRELADLGLNAVFIEADISRVADCERVVAEAIAALGSVNALVNSAASTGRGTLVDTTPEVFDELFSTNVRGPFFLMQGVVRHLLQIRQPGSLVNVLSMAAHAGQSFLAPYSSSKGALVTLTRNVANAYRRNRIRCNGVLPGWMDTPGEHIVQTVVHGADQDWLAKAEAAQPMGKLAKPAELAGLITYLLSPESGVMTGALIDYDQNVAGAYPE